MNKTGKEHFFKGEMWNQRFHWLKRYTHKRVEKLNLVQSFMSKTSCTEMFFKVWLPIAIARAQSKCHHQCSFLAIAPRELCYVFGAEKSEGSELLSAEMILFKTVCCDDVPAFSHDKLQQKYWHQLNIICRNPPFYILHKQEHHGGNHRWTKMFCQWLNETLGMYQYS